MRGGNTRPIFVDIGPAATVDSLVERWRVRAAASKADAARTSGDALRKRVWDPVAGAVGDAQLAFVVPDGALDLVNLSALPSGTGTRSCSRPGRRSTICRADATCCRAAQKTPAADNLLAMGAIDYNQAAAVGSLALAPQGGTSTVSAARVASHRSARSRTATTSSPRATTRCRGAGPRCGRSRRCGTRA